MRLFVGIPLAAPVIDELASISVRLQANGDGLRWSAPESWHITLQFLGNSSQQQYECVVARLRELRSLPVAIELAGVGFFDRAGIFYADINLTPELLVLQQHVIAATSRCGFIPEDRPYRPHITLARSKGKAGKQGIDGLKIKIRRQPCFTRFVADGFAVYESFTLPTGSHYEIRERFPLDGYSGNTQ